MSFRNVTIRLGERVESWSRTFDHGTLQIRADADGVHLWDSSDGEDLLVVDPRGLFVDQGVTEQTVADAMYDVLSQLQDEMSKATRNPWPRKEAPVNAPYAMPRTEIRDRCVVAGYATGKEWIDTVPLLAIPLEEFGVR